MCPHQPKVTSMPIATPLLCGLHTGVLTGSKPSCRVSAAMYARPLSERTSKTWVPRTPSTLPKRFSTASRSISHTGSPDSPLPFHARFSSSASLASGVRRVRALIQDPERTCRGWMLKRANPRAWQTALTGRHRPERTSAQSTFFGGVPHRLFEDFVFQHLLARHALQLGNLRTSGGKFGGRHHCLASGDSSQRPLPVELTPLEQQAGSNALQARNERHAHTRLIASSNQRGLLCKGPAHFACNAPLRSLSCCLHQQSLGQ